LSSNTEKINQTQCSGAPNERKKKQKKQKAKKSKKKQKKLFGI
jgi:hypothetical protein